MSKLARKLVVRSVIACAVALLCGCRSPHMKSTPFYEGGESSYRGPAEERVNLWPAFYHRDPATSVAWPVFSYSDDHMAVHPIYSQCRQSGAGGAYDEYNVLWPLAQADTRRGDYRVFPFFWDSRSFVAFPVLWLTPGYLVVPPLFMDWSLDKVMLFPLFYGDFEGEERSHTLFPLYYYSCEDAGERSVHETFWAACGLMGYLRRGGAVEDHWLLPLYACTQKGFFSLPWTRTTQGTTRENIFFAGFGGVTSVNDAYSSSWLMPLYYHDQDSFATPIFGATKSADWLLPVYYHDEDCLLTPIYGRAKKVDWALPLYYRNESDFYSLLWCQTSGTDGRLESAISPLLLSGYTYERRTGDELSYLLMGLAGRFTNENGKGGSWVFPFFYQDAERFFTLLYGHTKTSEWLAPIYYRDEDSFITPLAGKMGDADWLLPFYVRSGEDFTSLAYVRTVDKRTGARNEVYPPLFLERTWHTNSQESSWSALGGIVGGSTYANGARGSDWLAPFYYHEKGHSFLSLPFGWTGGGTSQTNSWWCTSLVGTRSGRENGGWVFPLLTTSESSTFERDAAYFEENRLPADIRLWTGVETNRWWNQKTRQMEVKSVRPYPAATRFSSHDRRTFLHLSDSNVEQQGHLRGGSRTNIYAMVKKEKFGNQLFFNHGGRRTVEFRTDTREKVCDRENLYTSLLVMLYRNDREVDRLTGRGIRAEQDFLWRIWNRKCWNGNVTIDAFPGYTYDKRKNGYTKTSFLWRLYRHEVDPKKGTSMDILFIPVLRPEGQ